MYPSDYLLALFEHTAWYFYQQDPENNVTSYIMFYDYIITTFLSYMTVTNMIISHKYFFVVFVALLL
jgi:hypothetical protein